MRLFRGLLIYTNNNNDIIKESILHTYLNEISNEILPLIYNNIKNYSRYENNKLYPTVISIESFYLFYELLYILCIKKNKKDIWSKHEDIIKVVELYNRYMESVRNTQYM